MGRRANTVADFWAKVAVDAPDECWEWQGSLEPTGYGRACLGFAPNGKAQRHFAHRLAWILTNGPIQADLCACHSCDNPVCCNPSHLFLGTRAENQQDRHAKGRDARGSKHGMARLDELQVCGIMARYLQGVRQIDITKEYGVSPYVVCSIVKGRTWGHVFEGG